MVWDGICYDGYTQLKIVQGTLNAVEYRNDIMDPIVLPFLQQRNVDHIYHYYNTRCHVVRVCQDFLNQNHIRFLPWPALSPDVSPIENSRHYLQELRDALVHEWNNIPQAFIQRLIGSMRRRYDDVVAGRGGLTRYLTPQTYILHDHFHLSMISSDNDVVKFC